MHIFQTSFVTAVLLLHTAFGCWHHSAECAGGGTAANGRAFGQSAGERGPQPIGSCAPECRRACSYLTQSDSAQATRPASSLAVPPSVADYQSPGSSCSELPSGSILAGPPLRLHLLKQVLLI